MNILGFGAVLWDDIEPRTGKMEHNSNSIQGERNIGGAVFNLIAHTRKLGAKSFIVSAVGKDKLGQKTLKVVESLGVSTKLIKMVDEPTCIIPVSFQSKEEPSYTIPKFTSWDLITLDQNDIEFIKESSFDCLCFGTLEQRNKVSRETLRLILEEGQFKNVFLDLNLRNYYTERRLRFSLAKSSIVKINDHELSVICDMFNLNTDSYERSIKSLADKFHLDIVSLTLGENGAFVGSTDEVHFCDGYEVEVTDTVGAGDAFSAGLLVKTLQEATLKEACDFGCRLGALTVTKKSSIPEYEICEIENLD